MEKYNYKAFIVIEGGDGSGKSSHAQRLVQWFQDMGHKAVYIHFPDYDETTGKVIKEMLDGKYGTNPDDVNMYAASMMYAVDRWSSIHSHYKEYFFNDYIIVADRYVASNLIHQGAKLINNNNTLLTMSSILNEYCDWLENIEYNMIKIPEPDMTIYLSLSPELSIERLEKTGKHLDIHEKLDFIERSYYTGKYYADYLDWSVIECGTKSINEIQEKVRDFAIGVI